MYTSAPSACELAVARLLLSPGKNHLWLAASRPGLDDDEVGATAAPLRRGIYPVDFGKMTPLTAPKTAEDSTFVADKMRQERRSKQKKGR